MRSRRDFLKSAGGGLAWMGLGGCLPALTGLASDARGTQDPEEVVVTVLHTNDVHSRIDPFPEGQGRYGGLAGAARRATLIERVRGKTPHTLLVDAGDTFQGTPYFNLFRGEVDFRIMSTLGYEAMAIGNHEFDAGLEGLRDACRFARFALLSANYDFSDTILRNIVKPYIVRDVGPVRVGIFGLGVILEGLVAGPQYRGVEYSDPIPVARRTVARLRAAERCDLVICLSHLGNDGYRGEPGDQELAREVGDIDLVVGGHSHTFMDEPTRVHHGERQTLVFQVGWAGINLGRVDFHMQAGSVTQAAARALPVGTAALESAALG